MTRLNCCTPDYSVFQVCSPKVNDAFSIYTSSKKFGLHAYGACAISNDPPNLYASTDATSPAHADILVRSWQRLSRCLGLHHETSLAYGLPFSAHGRLSSYKLRHADGMLKVLRKENLALPFSLTTMQGTRKPPIMFVGRSILLAAHRKLLQSQQRDVGASQYEVCMHATAAQRIPGSGGGCGRRAF